VQDPAIPADPRPRKESRRRPLAAATSIIPALPRIEIRAGGLGRIEVGCPGCAGPFRVELWDWQGRLRKVAEAKGRDLGEEIACLDVPPGSLPGGAYLLGVTHRGRKGYRKLVLPL
jgi:hypothetical protein